MSSEYRYFTPNLTSFLNSSTVTLGRGVVGGQISIPIFLFTLSWGANRTDALVSGCHQISHEGRLAYFLDGRDESCSSWMRFIQCARHKGEQNMFAFQYMGNIYYRAYKDIPEGAELLVWYDDSYPQYMGIPLEIKDTAPVGSGGTR